MMYLQQLIEQLDKILNEHGDVKVEVYNEVDDTYGDDVTVEFSDEDKPVVYISYRPIED